MRHAVARPEQARHSQTTRHSGYPKREVKAAYNLGRFAATYWPAARKVMPTGATIGDYRIKCEADLLATFSPEGTAFWTRFSTGSTTKLPAVPCTACPDSRMPATC